MADENDNDTGGDTSGGEAAPNPIMNVPDIKIDSSSFDMDAMKELSRFEYEREFGKDDGSSEEEVPFETEETYDASMEESDEEESEAVGDDADDEEEGDEEYEEEEEEGDEESVETNKSFLEAKTKDGKSVQVPKDAIFDVKVDGEIKQLSAQEVVDLASGNLYIDQEITKVRAEKDALTADRQTFENEATVARENMEMLYELSQNGTPEDVVEYWGILKGEDPTKMLEGWVSKAVQYAQQLQKMTPGERQLYNQNRQLQVRQKMTERATAKAQKEERLRQERATVETELGKHGLKWDDWMNSANEITKKLEAGEMSGTISPMDVVNYALKGSHDQLVRNAITKVDKSSFSNLDFISKISKAILREESLSGERLSLKEATKLVRRKLEKDKARLSENLSKKAVSAKKSGKAKSKKAGSRKQENKDIGPATLQEHRDRMWGDQF
jgi:hypothetical protein